MAVKQRKIDMHLLKLYQNAAGMLPTKLLGCNRPTTYYYSLFTGLTIGPAWQCFLLRVSLIDFVAIAI